MLILTTKNSNSSLLNPPQTIRAVICYVRRGDEYLLLLKASGRFGGGFWNAPGGKIELGESPEEAARREVREETGLIVNSLDRMGYLEFYFGAGKERPDWTAQVFACEDFSGELKESEEGKLQWTPSDKLPMDQMWEDDKYWLPLLVKGTKFRGVFEFTSDSKKLVSHRVEIIP